MDNVFHQPQGGNEMPRFGGRATMMRLPFIEDLQGLDAAFVGIPLDIGTSQRSGTRYGPRYIRTESVMIRPYNMATGAAPFDHCRWRISATYRLTPIVCSNRCRLSRITTPV